MKRILFIGLLLIGCGTADKAMGPEELAPKDLESAYEPLLGPTFTVDLPGGATMEFVWIEPGTFMMGSRSSLFPSDKPQHEVTLNRGFWLGKYELTQGQWEAVMGTTPWSNQSYVHVL